MSIRIAYFVNHYPAVSHSFIRREILALETQGVEVERVALRGWTGPLADPADVIERERTRFILREGPLRLLRTLVSELVRGPMRFLHAIKVATVLSRGSDRPLLLHWIYLVEAATLALWMRSMGLRHVHAHFGTNSTEVALLAGLLGESSFSFTVHGPDEFDRPRALALAEKIRRSAFVVGISSFTRSQLLRWAPQSDWEKIHVVHCGLEPAFYDGVSSQPEPAPRFVCIGRLSEQKGQLLLLDAMRWAFDRGHHFTMVFAGDGELRASIEARIRALGLDLHVTITGWISSVDVRRELLSARALVLPSFAEGLPVVIMEAMALRRPVITTFIAGIPELVQSGKNGWLVPAGDVEALGQAMIECLAADAETLKRLGDSGRERVLQRHDARLESAKLAELFSRQLGAPAAIEGLHA